MTHVIAAPYANLYTWEVTDRYFAFFIKPGESALDATIAMNSSVDGGTNWTWRSLGSPPAGCGSDLSATAFISGALAADGSAIWQFYVFVVDNNNVLWVNVSVDDGKTWNWQIQGFPVASDWFPPPLPDAVSRLNAESWQQDIFCHVIGGDGHLYVNYSEDSGATWRWADRGTSPGSYGGPQSSIAYYDGTRQSIYAFAAGSDGNLYANYGDGSTWNWLNLQQPPGFRVAPSGAFAYGLSSLTFLTGTGKGQKLDEAIFVFAVAFSGYGTGNQGYELFACYSLGGGTGWQWKTLGSPPGTGIAGISPNALLVTNESNAAVFKENVFVFALGGDLKVYAAFTPDATPGPEAIWTWQPRGLPPGEFGVILNGAVASFFVETSLASVPMFVFATGVETEEVHTCRWDGSAWTWHDQ